jgi:type I restriction enzyme S subunit
MRNEWRTGKLGELVAFKTGKLDSNAAVPDGDYPFFTCSQETLRTNTFSFDTECVLLAGNNANGIYPLKYFHGKFDAYQRTYVVKPRDTEVLTTKFLYYALRPKLSELRSISTGAATKFLTLTILNETKIQVPPLPLQRRIAGILSAYDELMENSQRRIRLLEAMARALYREWFVHFRIPAEVLTKAGASPKIKLVASPLGDIPQGWEVKTVKDVATVTYGFPFASRKFNTDGIGTPVIRIRDILDGSINTFTDEDAEPKYHIKNGEILVGMDGDFHMCIWSSGHALQNQRVAKFESNGEIGNYHLFLALELPIQTWNKSIVGTTVAHLGDMHIKTIQIVWPPAKILAKASEVLEPMSRQIIALKRQIQNLRRTRDLLLPRLLSAQVELAIVEVSA